MLVLLIRAEGSGKSHIGRIIERPPGVHFLHVEPLWMAFYAECKSSGGVPSVPDGIRVVHPQIAQALTSHEHVIVETTGESPEILTDLFSLAPAATTLSIRVSAPLELCLQRIAARAQAHQIPSDIATIRKVHHPSTASQVNAALVLENSAQSEEEIVASVGAALAARSRASTRNTP